MNKMFYIEKNTHIKKCVCRTQYFGTYDKISGKFYWCDNENGLIRSSRQAVNQIPVEGVQILTAKEVENLLQKNFKGVVFREYANNSEGIYAGNMTPASLFRAGVLTLGVKAGHIAFTFKAKTNFCDIIKNKKYTKSNKFYTYDEFISYKTNLIKEVEKNCSKEQKNKFYKSINGYVAEYIEYKNFNDWFNHFISNNLKWTCPNGYEMDVDIKIGICNVQIKCSLGNVAGCPALKDSKGISKTGDFFDLYAIATA